MLTEDLKEATQANHQQLEKQLVQQMKAIRTLPDYIALLQMFYTYFGGLEDAIQQYITTEQLADYPQRRKAAALAADIGDLGGEPEPKAAVGNLPVLHNYQQAFGALYVIEGSTLGGQIISKMIQKQLQLPESRGLSFFNGYGEYSVMMWETFKNTINTQLQYKTDADTLIAAANETFVKFGQWIQKSSATVQPQKV